MVKVPSNAPFSEQIYAAHILWAAAQRDFDSIESQRTILRDMEISKLMDQFQGKMSESKASRIVGGSQWYKDYMTEWVEAKHTALSAKGKWEYLQEVAKEMRDAGYQDRLMAKI